MFQVPINVVFFNGQFTFDEICNIANATKQEWSTTSEDNNTLIHLTIGDEVYRFKTNENSFRRESLFHLFAWSE